VNPAIIRPAAAAEIDEAYLWYESRRSGLGEEFLADVNQTLDRVREMPELYAVVKRDTCRAISSGFRIRYCTGSSRVKWLSSPAFTPGEIHVGGRTGRDADSGLQRTLPSVLPA
jgi:hypothetical protein